MKKVIITGGTGFIGSNLVKELIMLDFEINLIVREKSDISEFAYFNKKINIYIYDKKIETMLKIIDMVKPDIVIHLAALFVGEHEILDIDNLIESNISFGTHLLEGIRRSNVKYFINVGTNWQNYDSSNYNPKNLYAATKQAFEDIAKYYIESTGLRMITLKIYDSYGLNDQRMKIFNLLKKISITGDFLDMSEGDQLMGLVYIDDIVDAFIVTIDLIQKMEISTKKTYFLTPIKFLKLRELVSLYELTINKKLNIRWGVKPYRDREIMEPYIGKRLPNWEPKVDVYAGIKEIVKEI